MKKLFLIGMLLTAAIIAQSQTANFSNIKKIYLQGLSAISENNEVKGYSAFYFLDKADKKENVYEIDIPDNNLKQTHSVKMTLPKEMVMLENSFNGERFCYSFINHKEKYIKYMLLDKTGKKVGAYSATELSKGEMAYIEQSSGSESNAYSGGLIAVPGKGFVRYGMEKEKGMHCELEMIDNMGKKIWKANSKVPKTEKSYEGAYPFYANDKMVVSLMATRPKLLSTTDYEVFLTFHRVDDGKEAFRINMTSKDKKNKYVHAPIGVSYDELTDLYYVYGEYYPAGGKVMMDKSTGLYFQVVDTAGNIKNDNYSSWTGDIGKKVSMNDKGKFENNTNITIHKMVRTADGKIFAIGEQFKKAASALGIASTLLSRGGGGTSVAKIQIFNMMVFEYDSSFKLNKVHVIEKDKSNVELPQGMGMMGPSSLAYIMKMFGWFDYEFTTTSPDKRTFTSAYVNYDKDKEEGNSYAVGTVAYTKDANIATDKIRLTDKPTWFRVLPAKPGYVTIFEYFKKEKKMDARLEKLNL